MDTLEIPVNDAAAAAARVVTILKETLAKAEAGEIECVAVCVYDRTGGSFVRLSPGRPMVINHLGTMLQTRVLREYNQMMYSGNSAGKPPMRGVSPISPIPRAVRRAVDLAKKKEQKRKAKIAARPAAVG